ncbi:MAG: response regulator [Candidatus Marinimicrobia bacterium]|nr:response regulator [Candidatus Neomarinimicrobiota bacterium]
MDEERKPIILMVDDVPKNLQVLGNILNKEGYKISAALNGEQALKILENAKPDLILLDVMMPGLSGFDVIKEIQKNEELAEIPVIFLTAKTEKEDVIQGIELGAVDYVTKPFNSIELLARVRNHLELKLSKDRLKKMNAELQKALREIKTLKGLVPICANCKKIRDDDGFWQEVEHYVAAHTEADFSHGICPDCMKELYPEVYEKMKEAGKI